MRKYLFQRFNNPFILLLTVIIMAVILIYSNYTPSIKDIDNDACIEEYGCFNKFFAKRLQQDCPIRPGRSTSCRFSFGKYLDLLDVDKVYITGRFGARFEQCTTVPLSKEFIGSYKPACDYLVFTSGNKFTGYIRAGCASDIRLPAEKVSISVELNRAVSVIEPASTLLLEKRRVPMSNTKTGKNYTELIYAINKKSAKMGNVDEKETCFHY